MKRYRIDLTRHGRHWCQIVVESREPRNALADVVGRYPSDEGFELSVWEETEQTRIVELGQNTRVLSVTYERASFEIASTKRTACQRG